MWTPTILKSELPYSWYATLLAAVPVAVAGWLYLPYLAQHYFPPEYRYRPGTISNWLATQLSRRAKRRRRSRPIRVYLDGCFDMMHYGHANALRQAKALGDELVVGLIPGDEVLKIKGCSPVLSDAERWNLNFRYPKRDLCRQMCRTN